jgi:hypothetical protein
MALGALITMRPSTFSIYETALRLRSAAFGNLRNKATLMDFIAGGIPHYFGPRRLRERLATSGGLEHKERLQHLAPKRGFISPEPLEQAIVEIGEPLEALR